MAVRRTYSPITLPSAPTDKWLPASLYKTKKKGKRAMYEKKIRNEKKVLELPWKIQYSHS